MSLLSCNSQSATIFLVLCLATTRSQAFSTGRPLSLQPQNARHSIPGRAPVDVFYVDEESSEEQQLITASPIGEALESFQLNKELILDPDQVYQQQQQQPVLVDTETEELIRQQQELSSALSEHDIPPLPTMTDLRKFALPCFGLLLSGPLLSLVDTMFVGLASTTSVELAALGPATTLFDCLTWFLSFLNVATTNLYSSALAKGSTEEAEGVVRTGSRVGLTIGLGIMTILITFCKPILAGYMGPKAAATPGILAGASTYLTIRALSMPSFLLLGVLQSALLGAKDSVTPLKAIGYSTIVNIVGDWFLVNQLGMGLKGAAIATTAAQWAATIALIIPARKKLMESGKLGLLNLKRKSAISVKQFLSFSAPVILLLAGKLGVFGFLTQAAARVPGTTTPLASHQIILSLFLFLCPFVEVINQTAQTFLPPFYAPVKDHVAKMKQSDATYKQKDDQVVGKWNAASDKVCNTFLKSCFVIAATVATAGAVVPMSLGHTLTGDVAVQQALPALAKFLWWATFLMGPMSATEGILLARNKAWFLAIMYMVSTAVFPTALFTFGTGSIAGVWTCFCLFQAYRATLQTIRVTGVTPKKILNKTAQVLSAPFVRRHHGLAV
ncbi:Protein DETOXIFICATION [Seminavis robusta]|uniref:Protein DETOXIFICATION n=1 Tax=Seminavis robusta TaxID=568900 RepID=A0A9N8EQ10_9STRA|nr:Protein DETOXIFICATION [Seminavis robusta]|eukprot:Sro1367_g266730.1 Protein DETOXIFICATION (614) ;mRNA; r:15493-17434